MSQYFQIHPDNPQQRLLRSAADILADGGVIAYPTDSAYALGCRLGNREALNRIVRIRELDKRHNFTLVCDSLSGLGRYAKVDNSAFRLLKACTPGPYTFLLRASTEVPKIMLHPKRRVVGLRVPDSAVAQGLLAANGEAMLSTTLILPGEDLPLHEPYEIRERLEHQVDLVIDGGHCGIEPTTVVSLLDGVPDILREGRGDVAVFA